MAIRFTLRQLEYFIAVGEEGSIVGASQRVSVSSPSISAAVTQLEAELGLLLFVRKHAHGLTLTQAGKQFMEQARKVVKEAEAVNRLAATISGNVQGPLKVGCLLTFAQLIVPSLRREFEEAHPLVRISQSELDQTAIFDQLRNAQIDVALTYDLDIPSDIEFISLAELPPYAMVSDSHPLAHYPEVSLTDLQIHPMVLLDLPHSADYFLSFFEGVGAPPKIVERTRDMAVLRSLVANGFGYAIANIRPLNDVAPDGRRLRFLPLAGTPRPMHLGIALVDHTAKVLTVEAFVDHCRKRISTSGILRGTVNR